MNVRFAFLGFLAVASFCTAQKSPKIVLGPDITGKSVPRYVVKADGLIYDTLVFPKTFSGGVRVAVGDVTGDGVGDMIVAQDPGGDNLVRVFDGKTMTMLSSFQAFKTEPGKGKGVTICVGSNEAGLADTRIIAGSDAGSSPLVNVFDVKGNLLRSFLAFDPTFAGGVRVAAGDIDGDGFPEIMAGAGPGGSPIVNLFDGATGTFLRTVLVGDAAFSGGVFVASGDVDGDGFADLVTGAGAGGGTEIRKYTTVRRGDLLMNSYYAFRSDSRFDVYVAAADLDGDGYAEILVGTGPGGDSRVRIFHGKDDALMTTATAFPGWNTSGGVWVAASIN